MKWFKHFSDASHDEKMSEVLDLHGANAYGVFWLIVEAIAMQMDDSVKCEARYSMKKWANITHVDRRTLARYLQTFNILTLIVQQNCDKFVTIKIPKMLELRDNHTKNLQATIPVTCKQEVEVEVDKPVAKNKFSKPSLEDVRKYCEERKNNVDSQQWIDHYTSNGWRVGKNPMKDWKAAVRTWEKNSKTEQKHKQRTPQQQRNMGYE